MTPSATGTAVTPSGSLDRHTDNSIDFLRLLLAVAVACGHCYPVGGFPLGTGALLFGVPQYPRLAVGGFFFLSGFLIAGSYLESSSVGRYLWKRALRIFPAFWVCLFVTALVLGPIVSWGEGQRLVDYFRPGGDSAFRYVRMNALLWIGQSSIRNLPEHVHTPFQFNGSLWTLFTEFQCYLFVVLLGAIGVLQRGKALIALVLLFLLMNASAFVRHLPVFSFLFVHVLFGDERRLEQWLYFMIGCCAYQFRRRRILDRRLFALAFAVTFFVTVAAVRFVVLGEALAPFKLMLPLVELQSLPWSYCLLWLAFRLPLREYARRGDFSYGFYVYAFPVQQLLSVFGLNRFGFIPYFALTLACTLPLARASWFFVERPCLALKSLRIQDLFSPPATPMTRGRRS